MNLIRKGVRKMTAILSFLGIGVATVFLVVGELCFSCATWIAKRCGRDAMDLKNARKRKETK